LQFSTDTIMQVTKMINQTAFDSIYNFFSGNALYIIPTFQRPFRWEEIQVSTLIDDICMAHARSREHYLSPLHLIKIDTSLSGDIALLNKYTDPSICPSVPASGDLTCELGMPVDIYLVVDGQQRLTAIQALLVACAVPFVRSITIGGVIYPKLIAGSPAEDAAIRSALGLAPLGTPAVPPTAAATRISNAFKLAAERVAEGTPPTPAFLQRSIKALGVCLDPPFGLGAFLTLNDRGLSLTTLEKLKAHCMYLDSQNATPNSAAVHTAFGSLYHSIEHPESLLSDNQAVQIATLFHVNGSFPNTNIVWWEAERCFKDVLCFKDVPSDTSILHSGNLNAFLTTIQEIANANNTLISGLATPATAYTFQLAMKRKTLSHRALAVLFRFYALHWGSQTCSVRLPSNAQFASYLNTQLSSLISPGTPLSAPLSDYPATISSDIAALGAMPERPVSVLDLVVMIDACGVKTASFLTAWRSAFTEGATPHRAFQAWADYLDTWYSRFNYLRDLLAPGDDAPNSLRYKVALLKEKALGREWPIGDDTVEHIFAKALSSSLTGGYGFSHKADYDAFCCKLGNLIPLDERLNSSISANPPHVKASYYISQQTLSGKSVAPAGLTPLTYSPSAVAVGNRINLLSNPTEQRIFIELRTIEMACFAATVL
jgi:hypothetical protein